MSYKKNPKFLNQIQYCERERVPFMVVVGAEERERGGVKIRDVVQQTEVGVKILFTSHLCCMLFSAQDFVEYGQVTDVLHRLLETGGHR